MNASSNIEFVLLVSPGLWACVWSLLWLWLHRRVPVSRRYGGARRPVHQAAQSNNTHWRSKPEWVRRKVIYLASHLSGCRTIARAFNAAHGMYATVGKTWVAELLREEADAIRSYKRRRKRRPPVPIAVGHTWALDLTYWRSPDGLTFTVLGIIDAGSRKLLCLRLLPTKCVHYILAALHQTWAEYGLPYEIRTDNEAMFTSAPWKFTLKYLAIVHRRGPPLQPWHNGRIERLFGTLKGILGRLRIATAACLQFALDQFKQFYNLCRRHSALNGVTPQEAWQGKSLADVQRSYARNGRRWVQALGGLMVAYHVRC